MMGAEDSLPHVRVNGIQLYYEDSGAGQPVLYFHGGFGGPETTLITRPHAITGVLPPEQYRTITIDRRNSGRSDYDTAKVRLEDFAADARGVLVAIGIERAVIVGDSLGGPVAKRFAFDYPDATRGLVLMATSARILADSPETKAAQWAMRVVGPRRLYSMFRNKFREPEWVKSSGPRRLPYEVRFSPDQHAEFRRRLDELADGELCRYSSGQMRTYAAFAGRDLRAELPKLTMPVAIIHGAADADIHKTHAREMAALIPHATYTELPGLGHGLLFFLEGREALRRAIASICGPMQDAETAAG